MRTVKRPTGPEIRVSVDKKLIEESVERDSSHCMIAEAIRVAYPGAKFVSVDIQTIRFTDVDKKLRFTYLTPHRVQKSLLEFDQGKKPPQFNFMLRQPQVTISGSKSTGTRTMSPAQRESVQKNLVEPKKQAAKNARESLKKSTLRRGRATKTSTTPVRTGGRTPPTTPFARIRAFGLRALEF